MIFTLSQKSESLLCTEYVCIIESDIELLYVPHEVGLHTYDERTYIHTYVSIIQARQGANN